MGMLRAGVTERKSQFAFAVAALILSVVALFSVSALHLESKRSAIEARGEFIQQRYGVVVTAEQVDQLGFPSQAPDGAKKFGTATLNIGGRLVDVQLAWTGDSYVLLDEGSSTELRPR
jgi:glucose/arabinose dehydrogenase